MCGGEARPPTRLKGDHRPGGVQLRASSRPPASSDHRRHPKAVTSPAFDPVRRETPHRPHPPRARNGRPPGASKEWWEKSRTEVEQDDRGGGGPYELGDPQACTEIGRCWCASTFRIIIRQNSCRSLRVALLAGMNGRRPKLDSWHQAAALLHDVGRLTPSTRGPTGCGGSLAEAWRTALGLKRQSGPPTERKPQSLPPKPTCTRRTDHPTRPAPAGRVREQM